MRLSCGLGPAKDVVEQVPHAEISGVEDNPASSGPAKGKYRASVPGVLALVLAGLVASAIPGPGQAAEPSFDCSKVDSSAEEAICASEDLAMLDQELARLYKLALDDPHLSADQISTLKAMQRGWIKGRNDCWKASVGLETCIAGSYVMRG